MVGAVAELAEKNVSLTGTVGVLQKDAAEREVDGYIGVGRLLPKSRARAVTLVLSGDREGLDDFLAPENAPYVKLGDVRGPRRRRASSGTPRTSTRRSCG